ncbi:hypothetical protein FJZ48_04175, partial [Candidatus Uhrbacteria bacterium]|nr:hypothetical protein [Candidatus Uhrbacteria bacterium]
MTTVFITFFGKYLVFFLPAIAVLFFLCLQKNAKVKLFWFSIITVPTIFILSRIASRLYFHPRPFVVEGVAPLIPHAPDNGFPSDHALLSFTISAIVFTQNKK